MRLDTARSFFGADIYRFNELEERALRLFFTNTTKRVFLMHLLPLSVGDVLLAMYSRMKHPQGLRGLFANVFLPQFLAANLSEVDTDFGGDPAKYLKAKGVNSLESFVRSSPAASKSLDDFLAKVTTDPSYIQHFCESKRVKVFLAMWLDKYGHNSIARMAGGYWICCEQISILAAKSLEWGRPGKGYIELSTRYVDMAGKELYPIIEELAEYGLDPAEVTAVMELAFRYYRTLQGEKLDGVFPAHLREIYGSCVAASDLEMGVFGETCDVLGNFLPAATLTSVGIASSGEGLPSLVRHLLMDRTPENAVLAECIAKEGEKLGMNQFLRHVGPTQWQTAAWEYLAIDSFTQAIKGCQQLVSPTILYGEAPLPPKAWVEDVLLRSFRKQATHSDARSFGDVIDHLRTVPRNEYDKLPNHFERVSVSFEGVMSFRGWRDLQRQGFCTHYRTHLTPDLGFYWYDKSAPKEFNDACRDIHSANERLCRKMTAAGVPPELAQYPLALGNMVGFQVSGNLLQMEFSNWQRSKFSVNHEVRQIFLEMENALRSAYPWWSAISRADIVPAYVFARGEGAVPLETVNR
jgi:hypothetical protein